MQKITPCLWFDDRLEEAINFYSSIFPDLEVLNINRYPEGISELAGMLLTATFRMAGQTFIGLNGGPIFKFTEAVSFSIDCESQEEIDYYWNRLIEGGEESMCGWLKDKFGLSWQVVPTELGSWLYHPAPEQAQRAMQALFKMKKINIEKLKLAVS
jgi:predicted 3-demethylubiquinone-9 3-methyltransferase (glyoxalase superfamily)